MRELYLRLGLAVLAALTFAPVSVDRAVAAEHQNVPVIMVQGEVTVVHIDYFEQGRSKTSYYLRDLASNTVFQLQFERQPPATLKTGDKLYFFRPKSGTAGMGDMGQETFEHTQVVDSIQIFHLGQYRQVSQISILEYPGGAKKSIVKFVDDLNNPVLLSDRHCAIAVSRLAPNNAEVTLAELVSPARADDDDEARPALILDTDNDGAC